MRHISIIFTSLLFVVGYAVSGNAQNSVEPPQTIALTDTLSGENKYLRIPDGTEEYYSTFPYREYAITVSNQFIQVDSLLGRKEFFIYMIYKTVVIGIKEENGCLLTIGTDGSNYTENYLIKWSKCDIAGLFEPLPDANVFIDKEYNPFYFYFIRFTADGQYDLEFDCHILVGKNKRRARNPLHEELGYLGNYFARYLYNIHLHETMEQ